MSINPKDVYPLIYDFFLQNGFLKLAEKVRKKTKFDDQLKGLRKKKLLKICKYYVRKHPKM
jgi:hypothetical protein